MGYEGGRFGELDKSIRMGSFGFRCCGCCGCRGSGVVLWRLVLFFGPLLQSAFPLLLFLLLFYFLLVGLRYDLILGPLGGASGRGLSCSGEKCC